MLKHVGFLALDLVDDAEEIRDAFFGNSVSGGEVDPGHPVGDADDEVTGDEAEGKHRFDRQGNEFRIGGGSAFAEDIDVELMELASPALLRFFVAETLADLEPLERLREIPLVLGDDPRERGGDFRTERDIATALVLEAEKLRGKLAAGLFQIECSVLQNGGFVFDITAAAGHAAPGFEQIIAHRAFTGSEVAESWKCLESRSCHGRAARMHAVSSISRRDCSDYWPDTGAMKTD